MTRPNPEAHPVGRASHGSRYLRKNRFEGRIPKRVNQVVV